MLMLRVTLHMRSAHCGKCMLTLCLMWALMGLSSVVPGSLVVSRGLIGGVALASTDATIGGVLHWFALGHKHHLMDVAMAKSYGWVMWWPFKAISRKKKSKPKPKPKSRKGKEKAVEEVEEVEEGTRGEE